MGIFIFRQPPSLAIKPCWSVHLCCECVTYFFLVSMTSFNHTWYKRCLKPYIYFYFDISSSKWNHSILCYRTEQSINVWLQIGDGESSEDEDSSSDDDDEKNDNDSLSLSSDDEDEVAEVPVEQGAKAKEEDARPKAGVYSVQLYIYILNKFQHSYILEALA